MKKGEDIVFLTKKPDIENPEEKLNVEAVDIMGGSFFGRRVKSLLRRFFPFDPVSALSSYYILKRIKPDIVHLHLFNELSLSVIWSAKKLGLPVVFSMYDYWIVCPKGTLVNGKNEKCSALQGGDCDKCFWINNKKATALKRIGFLKIAFWLREKVMLHFLKKIDHYLVLSNSWVKLLNDYGISRDKLEIIPLPLPEIDNVEKSVNEKMVLFTGWVYPHKGLHILVRAMGRAVKEVPGLKLSVVESGADENYKKEILKDVDALGIKENVLFLGKLPNKEVRSLLAEAKIAVIPEQWGIAWPIFLTEAMLFGKQIVASRIGDIPDFIEDGKNGFLANPKNSDDFADKIIRLAKERNDFGEKAREKILSICNDKNILNRLEKVYLLLKE
jgi:glycosyltransferase involved in cell wall biosynthesis